MNLGTASARRVRSRRPWLFLALAAVLAPLAIGAETVEGELILEALGLCEGMSAADVGAGDGELTSVLARKVGPTGRVYATEVERDKVEELKERAASDGLLNVTAVLGDQQSTGLASGCCEGILLRMVYHHFTDPPAMRRSLWRALRPGGRIVVIEVPPQAGWRHLEGVPERGGHGIPRDDLVAEMRRAGFEVLQRHDTWPGEDDSYAVVFRRPAPDTPAGRNSASGGPGDPATP
jgi:ubiquinone/menaquinone biosynthesis C-methylase UbiE